MHMYGPILLDENRMEAKSNLKELLSSLKDKEFVNITLISYIEENFKQIWKDKRNNMSS